MKTVALFGTGKIGEAILCLLSQSGRYSMKACDLNENHAKELSSQKNNISSHKLDLQNKTQTLKLLEGCDAVISALPYYCNVTVAELAREAGIHYFDLTEDVDTSNRIEALAKGSSLCFMPQCGLAPGFISVAAAHLMERFDSLESVKMRVGALPVFPSNQLKYNLTWSTEGLINEYGNPCEVIHDGKKQSALPLEGYERFSLDGIEYEAFNTSGGLGTLCDTYAGKVRYLDYKSVRYPGHRDLMAFLMNGLRFNEDRTTLKNVFERSIPTTNQDKCIIFVEVIGKIGARLVQKTYANTVYNAEVAGSHFGAIQITTASGICAPLDLVLSGKLSKAKGFARVELIPLPLFLENEFGKYYRNAEAEKSHSH